MRRAHSLAETCLPASRLFRRGAQELQGSRSVHHQRYIASFEVQSPDRILQVSVHPCLHGPTGSAAACIQKPVILNSSRAGPCELNCHCPIRQNPGSHIMHSISRSQHALVSRAALCCKIIDSSEVPHIESSQECVSTAFPGSSNADIMPFSSFFR